MKTQTAKQQTQVVIRNRNSGLYYIEGRHFTGKHRGDATRFRSSDPSVAVVLASYDNTETIPAPQVIAGHTARIVRRTTGGERFAMIDERNLIPLDLLGMAAGKDAWMRGIIFRCSDCRTPRPASEMEAQLCPECLQRAEDENTALNA